MKLFLLAAGRLAVLARRTRQKLDALEHGYVGVDYCVSILYIGAIEVIVQADGLTEIRHPHLEPVRFAFRHLARSALAGSKSANPIRCLRRRRQVIENPTFHRVRVREPEEERIRKELARYPERTPFASFRNEVPRCAVSILGP